MKSTSFKPGQRYADYQKGDKTSDIGLAGLIAGDDDSSVAQKDGVATSGKSAGGWGWYVFAGVLAGGGVLLFLGAAQQRRKPRHVLPASPVENGIGNHNEPVQANVTATLPASVTPPEPVMPEQDLEVDDVKPAEVKPIGERPSGHGHQWLQQTSAFPPPPENL